jgi:hypothetical protein
MFVCVFYLDSMQQILMKYGICEIFYGICGLHWNLSADLILVCIVVV